MKKITYLLLLQALLICFGCTKDDEMPVIKPVHTGVFKDERDGTEYKWVRYGKLDWMAENVRVKPKTGGYKKYCNTATQNIERESEKNYQYYGYLYDFKAANNVAPEGWRLPTDADWAELEQIMGMGQDGINRIGWSHGCEGSLMMQDETGSGLHLLTGGYIDNLADVTKWQSYYLGTYGFFWTATTDEQKEKELSAFYRKIKFDALGVYRASTYKVKYMSVRCVRDSQ